MDLLLTTAIKVSQKRAYSWDLEVLPNQIDNVARAETIFVRRDCPPGGPYTAKD